MFLLKFIFHYMALPTLFALISAYISVMVSNQIPLLLNRVGMENNINEILEISTLISQNILLFQIAFAAFISTIIATFIQRSISVVYRGVRGDGYKKGSKDELV